MKRHYLNSLGNRVPAKTLVNTYPYKLERCDQIVIINGEFIRFGKEYICLKQGVFVFTSQAINVFKSESPESLAESMDLSDIHDCSYNLRPLDKCLDITSKTQEKMTLCSEYIGKVYDLLKDFSECRKGNPIKPIKAKECVYGKFTD
jgi:hypothetical protein